MKANYQLFQEQFVGAAVGLAALGLLMKGVSKSNLNKLEDAFLESYENTLFTMEVEIDDNQRSKLKEFLENITLNRRLKNKAIDEGEIVLINNRKTYNKVMQKLGKFPMFSSMKKQDSISFTPEEFNRKHKRLYGITGDKFMQMVGGDKDVNRNLLWLHHALKILSKSSDDKIIKKITFHSYPPQTSYIQNV